MAWRRHGRRRGGRTLAASATAFVVSAFAVAALAWTAGAPVAGVAPGQARAAGESGPEDRGGSPGQEDRRSGEQGGDPGGAGSGGGGGGGSGTAPGSPGAPSPAGVGGGGEAGKGTAGGARMPSNEAAGGRAAGGASAVASGAPLGGAGPGGAAVVLAAPVEARLRILVLERGTRRPLEAATISVGAVPVGETDISGRLTISLAPGPHQIEAQFPGHTPSRDAVELPPGGGGELIIRLDIQAEGERYETEVRSQHKELASFTIDARESTHIAGTSGDPIRVLASLPGVSQVVWPAAIFVVRGSNPGNTGFFIDGIRVPATFHLALGPSIIAPDLLESMDFFPGAYPANYGRYISGVVSIHTARPPEDRLHLYADVSFYEARAVATTPVHDGRGVVAAAARYSYTGPLVSLFNDGTTIDYRDYQLRFDHRLAGGQATIFAFGSLDQLDWTSQPTKTMPDKVVTQTAALQFHRLDLRWSGALFGGRLLVGVTGGYDHARSSLSQAPLTVDSVGVAPRLTWTRRLGAAFDLELGGDAEYQHFEAHPLPFVTGKPSDLGRSRAALTQGTFATVRFHPTDRLMISPGLRGDLFAEEQTSRFVLEPRLDARLDLSSWFWLTLNFGRFSQMPSLPVNVAGFESFGLASIGLQRSDAISGGVNARAFGDTTVEVTGFYSRMRVTDVSELDLQSGKITGDDYLILHDGVGYGVQTMIRRPFSHRVNGWLSYTLSWALRNGSNGVVRSDWDQRHLLNLVGSYAAGAGFTFSARAHFATGRELAVPPATKRIQAPDYYQIDVRIERKIVFDRFVLTAFLDVANLLYRRQLVEYASTTAGPVPTYLRLVLPALGINGAF